MSAKNRFENIRKRDGRIVPFQSEKILKAIERAGQASGEIGRPQAASLTKKVLRAANRRLVQGIPTVEEIQDIVEHCLLTSPYKKTAKLYILYRDQHAKIRDILSKSTIELVDGYIDHIDWEVKENSNMTYSLQGLNNYVSSEISKRYWVNKIYPREIAKAHLSGDFHIHDLSILAVYCVGWDLQDLLLQGFKGASGKIESNPAQHFRTALGQIVNFFYTLQGEAAGAQAFSNFDTLLAPFIYYDKLTKKEVRQALEEFIFNINVPTRVGFQTPFTNLTMDLNVPKLYKNVPAIIGGKPQKKTYGEFQKQMDILNKAFLEVMMAGDAKGRVFTFPIPTYNLTKDFDWDRKDLDILWKVTAKYGVPYFANFVNSDMSPEDARSMCCRLRLDLRNLEKRGGGLFGAKPLTGSVGVVTINLPRLGYLAKDKREFFERLNSLLRISKESLEIKRKVLESLTDNDLYPYSKYYLREVKERFGKYWANHFSTIGLVGMNEACLNLYGYGIGTQKGKTFAEDVLDHMRESLLDFQKETGHNYNLEATPAEGAAYRLAKKDKEKFPDIICANEVNYKKGAKPYYTNSSQLPVTYTDDVFEAFDLQDSLQTKYTGGTVLHAFLGESLPSAESTKKLVKVLVSNYHLPYFTITPTFSICPTHGYLAGEHYYCPKCDQEINPEKVKIKNKLKGGE